MSAEEAEPGYHGHRTQLQGIALLIAFQHVQHLTDVVKTTSSNHDWIPEVPKFWVFVAHSVYVITADADVILPRTFMVLQGAKDSKVKKAIEEIGYSEFLEKYRLIAQMIAEVDGISTDSRVTLKVRVVGEPSDSKSESMQILMCTYVKNLVAAVSM